MYICVYVYTYIHICIYLLLDFFGNRLILCVDIKNQNVFSRLLQIAIFKLRTHSLCGPTISFLQDARVLLRFTRHVCGFTQSRREATLIVKMRFFALSHRSKETRYILSVGKVRRVSPGVRTGGLFEHTDHVALRRV